MSENKMIIAGIDAEKNIYVVKNPEYEYRNVKKQNDVYEVLKEELYREVGVMLDIQPVSEYVGMCQYRRFFTEMVSKEACIEEGYLNDKNSQKYGLNMFSIEKVMSHAQIVRPKMESLKGKARNVRDYFCKFDQKHDTKHFEVFQEVFREKCQEYMVEYEVYMKSHEAIMHNMMIMHRELFLEYKQLVASVLSALDERLDMRYISYEQTKEYSMFTMVLLAVFCLHKEKEGVSVRELTIVEFNDVFVKEEWQPAFNENNIALVLASSDFYTIYLSAMLESIVENASAENNYDITVLESGIKDDNKRALRLLEEEHDNISIRFYNVKEKMADIHLKATGHISVETYYRLLIPEIR